MNISIVTITYNNFSELKRTLDSIPKLDFVESVVVNGGDCTETKEFLKSHRGKSISKKDNGISDAFNKGIQLASGDLIMLLNSGDVLIDPNYLTKARDQFLTNKEIGFVHSNLILKDASRTDLFMKPTFSNLGRGMPYLHPTMIVRKKIFDSVGMFNLNYKIAMDFDFVVRLKKKKLRGYYVNEGFPIAMDGTGKSITKEGKAIRECFTILKENKELNIQNLLGYFQRYILFWGRKFLVLSGQSDLLSKLKTRKHTN
jgi:glycosyltransferase involved in cell wall biosynthesis